MKKIYPKLFKAVFKAVVGQELRGGTGENKRAAAIAFINGLVNIPYLPEWIERILFGLLVDFLVWLFNLLFGHKWINRNVNDGKIPTETTND